jgi:maleylacetate reductase
LRQVKRRSILSISNLKPFVATNLASRVVFGAGSLSSVPSEVAALGLSKIFLITDGAAASFADIAAAALRSKVALRWNEVAQHVPVELAARARAAVDECGADGVVCIGGGSTTGLAKAIALTHRLPIIAVPTTYAGSEMTSIYGLTGGAHKQTGKDPIVVPRTVIYDPELTFGLPAVVTGPSGFNALAHCVEALYGPGNNPVTSVLALEGIRAIGRSLKQCIESPTNVDARSDLLYGAHLAGVALGQTGTALHHKACHVLGGMFNLVHGDMNSVVLPHAVEFNAPAIPDLVAKIATALNAPIGTSAAQAFFDLAVACGSPTSLASIGMPESGITEAAPHVVADTMANANINPRTIDVAQAEVFLRAAYVGTRP